MLPKSAVVFLGSTASTVNGTTETGEVRYLPWGKDRFTIAIQLETRNTCKWIPLCSRPFILEFIWDCYSGATPTSYKFTGQREEIGLGLYYYGARWYDPALGRLIQPDTLVPNPGDVQSFDRYAYVLNNPLKYNDPSGHCVNSLTKNAGDSIEYDNADCWRFANTIANMWDSTDYWSIRFGTKDVFLKSIATDATNGTDFFRSQFDFFLQDDAGKEWLDDTIVPSKYPVVTLHPVDAVGVGIGLSADIPVLEAAGISLGGGIEVLAHKNGQVAVYLARGGGVTVGAGANANLYVVRVRNLEDAKGYEGPSMGSDVTASLLVGLVAGTFEGPNGGAYGEKYGFAPGANVSGSVIRSTYSSPWIILDSRPK